MSCTSFPSPDDQRAQNYELQSIAFGLVGASTSTTWAIMTATGAAETASIQTYSSGWTAFRTAATNWGWRCDVPGFYMVTVTVNMAAGTLAAPPQVVPFALGLNGAEAAATVATTVRLNFDAEDDVEQGQMVMMRRFVVGDVIAIGTKVDLSGITIGETTPGTQAVFQRLRE